MSLLDESVNRRAYDTTFWFTYLSNSALMVAVSMMFRYSDFVSVLSVNAEHAEFRLGWIVGVGASGSIAMRMLQGAAIDRLGTGLVWIVSLSAVAISLFAHVWVVRVDSATIYLIRILYATSVAGSFGASITFVSLRAPIGRTAELIGVLGSSGFLGMALGPAVADSMLALVDLQHVHLLFQSAATVVVFATAFAVAASVSYGRTRKSRKKRLGRKPPTWWIVRRYNPGAILLMGLAMGIGIGLPFVFVRPFAESLNVGGIRWFFLVYAATAFTVRVFTRRLPDRWGVRPTVTLGMSFLAASMFSYLIATNGTLLLIPALLGGIAHAFVFPAAVAGCSLAFPMRHRGVATTLMLTMFDIGSLIGPPTVGSILNATRRWELPDYKITFAVVATALLVLTVAYAAASRKVSSTSGT